MLFPSTCSESWDLSKVPAPVAAALTGSRVLWSARASAKQTSDTISSKVNESLQSLGSMDDDEYYMNPNDPTRVSAARSECSYKASTATKRG